MFNDKGVRFIHERTNPLDVNTMDRAAEVIAKELAKRDERIAAGNPLRSDDDLVAVGRHLAWVVGFDTLVDQRREIRAHTDLIVKEAR